MDKYKFKQKGFILPILILATFVMIFISGYLYLKSSEEKPEIIQEFQSKLNVKSIDEQIQSVAEIAITKDGFVPQTVSIVAGQQITFVNKNNSAHRIVPYPKTAINNLPELDSENLEPTDSFTYAFEKIGTFTVGDSLTPKKYKATIIVN